MTWVTDPLAERRAERDRLIALAREYATALQTELRVSAAVVGGSVARGDFNLWSDVDVLVVSDELPEGAAARSALLASSVPARVEPHGLTSAELRRAFERRDRFVCEAAELGVPILGRLPR